MFLPIDQLSQRRVFDVENTTAEEIPANAVMRITGADTDTGLVKVGKPNADSLSLICFNVDSPIPANGEGQATISYPTRVLYDDAGGTPAAAQPPERWGAASGSWKATKGKSGLFAWGGAANGTAVFGPGELRAWTPPLVMTDWECVDDVPTLTKKYICADGSLVDDSASCP